MFYVHNLFGSATQSNSTDPLSVYNTCLCQLLDRSAPVATHTVTDRTSAPWMILEIKQTKVQRRLSERKWRESSLTLHREIYVNHLRSNMISKAKKDYLSHKIETVVVLGNFRLSSQIMGHSEMLCIPQIFLLSLYLMNVMNSLCIRLKRSEAALTLTNISPLILLNSLT